MPTPDTIAALKKSCQLARKKDLRFYFFAKATDGEPELVIGKASAARQQQQALVKAHRAKPAAQGVLTHSDQGLTFELYKGKPAALKRALKSSFSAVPALKGADVAVHKKKASKQSRLQAALKGGPKAFARRAGKVEAALGMLAGLHRRLLDAGVADSDGAKALKSLSRELEEARVLAETDPKDAYAELASVKDRIAELIAEREETLQEQAEEGVSRKLTKACKAIDDLAASIDELAHAKTPVSSLKRSLTALRGQLTEAEEESDGSRVEVLDSALRASTRALREQIAQRAQQHQRVTDRSSAASAILAEVAPLLKTLARKKIDTGGAAKQLPQLLAALAAAEAAEDVSAGAAAVEQVHRRASALRQALLQQAQQAPPDKKLAGRIQKTGKLIGELDALCQASAEAWDTSAQRKAAASLRARLQDAEALAVTDVRAAYSAVTEIRNETLRATAEIKEQAKDPAATRLAIRTRALEARKAAVEKRIPDNSSGLRSHDRAAALIKQLPQGLAFTLGSSKEADTLSSQLDQLEQLVEAVIQDVALKRSIVPAAAGCREALDRARAHQPGLALLKVDGHAKRAEEIAALAKALDAAEQKAKTEPAGLDKEVARLSAEAKALRRPPQQQLDGAVDSASDDEKPRLAALHALHLLRVSLSRATAIHGALKRTKQHSSDVAEQLGELKARAEDLDSEIDYDPVAALSLIEVVDADAVKLRTALELKQDALRRYEDQMGRMLGTLDKIFRHPYLIKEFRAFAISEYSFENVAFYAALKGGRLRSPRAREQAYWEFLVAGSPSELNLTRAEVAACFPEPPTEQHRGDALFWNAADYSGLEPSIKVNLSDTFSRFKGLLHGRLAADLRGTSLRNAQKVIKRWVDRMS